MSTLYRDYRPQTFKEVLGQNHIKITLQNEISADKMAQAFLFCGPRAVGKTTLARVLAKAVNCLNRKGSDYEPCNTCANCLNTSLGKNLDVVEIDAASNTGVDNVRENIISFSRLTPSNSRFKVFIIDEVHMLSISAFNALLKIIEEPPVHVIFILCTTEIQKVPATIISRCERFDFKRISVLDIVKKLSIIAAAEKIEVESEVLEAVARRSGGHLRDAESLLGQVLVLGDKKITLEQAELVIPHYNNNEALDILDYLRRKDASKAISLVNGLVDTGVNLKNFSGELISLLRKIMLNKVNPSLTDNLGLNLGESLEMKINNISSGLSWDQIVTFTRRFLEAYNDNKNSLIPQLSLELAIIDLCYVNKTALVSGGNPPVERKILNIESYQSKTNGATKITEKADDASNPVVELPATQAVREKNDSIISLDHREVLEKWPEFLVKIKKYNHSLSFVLQNCQPEEIKENNLCLVFKYKFHQDRINDLAIKQIVENTLFEVFGVNLNFSSTIDENLDIERSSSVAAETSLEKKLENDTSPSTVTKMSDQPGSLVGDLLKTFGGEVIN